VVHRLHMRANRGMNEQEELTDEVGEVVVDDPLSLVVLEMEPPGTST